MQQTRKKSPRIKIRRKWLINPRTRVRKSKKVYSRKMPKGTLENNDETTEGA